MMGGSAAARKTTPSEVEGVGIEPVQEDFHPEDQHGAMNEILWQFHH